MTDTCDIMINIWEELENYAEFKYYLFISCDNYDIQFIIKDILKISAFSNIIDQAQNLAKSFRKISLQYTHL